LAVGRASGRADKVVLQGRRNPVNQLRSAEGDDGGQVADRARRGEPPGRLGGVGPGSRCPCWCRLESGARSRHGPRSFQGAWRTSGWSAAAPSGDHAGLSSVAKQQVRGRDPSLGCHRGLEPKSVPGVGKERDPAKWPGSSGINCLTLMYARTSWRPPPTDCCSTSCFLCARCLVRTL